MHALNKLVLLLNSTYEAIGTCSVRHALKLVIKGKARTLELSKAKLHTSRIDLPVPSVIKLEHYANVPRKSKTISRKGVLLRDGYTCQYCGVRMSSGDLTLDHVIPRSRSGPNTWENLVASCFPCNNRKKDKTPDEAGMVLRRRPCQLLVHAKHKLMAGDAYPEWDIYLFVK